MKKRKGFTLVELIAVIVILIILMVIAVSMANKHMENSRINVFLKEANTFARGAMQKESVDRDVDLAADDLYHNTNYGRVCYSITQGVLSKYVTKTNNKYQGSVEVCYGLDCEYSTKIWITDGKHYIDGLTDPKDVSQVSGSFTTPYPYSCGQVAIGGGNAGGDMYVANFDYSGKQEEFDVLVDGVYALEVWGAQGGDYNVNNVGGYGAYAYTEVELHRNEKLYINVGGKGPGTLKSGETQKGGYNGGGLNSSGRGGGGGATSIATKPGLLYDVPIDYVYIIAGGGAASNGDVSQFVYRHAGGYTAANTSVGNSCAGDSYGRFGVYGGIRPDVTNAYLGYGAGYSVASCYNSSDTWPMAGGTSYVFHPKTKNGVMYCYNCPQSHSVCCYSQSPFPFSTSRTITFGEYSEDPLPHYSKLGNGYARITYIGEFTE